MKSTLSIDAEKLLNTFLAMVRINSPSGGEGEMREYLTDRLNALGLAYTVDPKGNVIAEVPRYGCDHDDVLVLSGHMDVVPPCLDIQPVIEDLDGDRIIQSDKTTVLGADDKAGLAPILETVAFALEHDLPRPRLRLIFTVEEETGLSGAKRLSDDVLRAGFAATFDHTGKQGVIINQAPTYVAWKIICVGKSVHAGIMPEQGVNAIIFAARIIKRLSAERHTGRIDADTTANLGILKGGKGTNVVPDEVVLEGELRSHNPDVIESELTAIRRILEEEKEKFPGSDYTFETHTEFEAYRIDENHPGVRLIRQAARDAGLAPTLIRTNGGSDNNVFVKRGLPGVVLSAGYMDPHAVSERVRLSEMVQCARFIMAMCSVFAQERFGS